MGPKKAEAGTGLLLSAKAWQISQSVEEGNALRKERAWLV